jgi:type IV pilus assembly protein PilQ
MRASVLASILIGVLLSPVVPAVGGPGLVVTGVRVTPGPGQVDVAIDASGPVGYRVLELEDPARVVIDIPEALNGVGETTIPVHWGPLVQVRVSQFAETPPVTRVVVDLTRRLQYAVTQRRQNLVVAGFVLPGMRAAAGGALTSGELARSAEHRTVLDATPRAGSASPVEVTAGPAGLGGITVVTQAGPRQPARLNMDLRGADLPDVLDALARLCGLNLVTDASVQGKVTIHLVGVTCEEGVRFLLDANGLGFRRVGDTLIVVAASKLTPPPPVPVVRVYRLQYLQPPLSAVEPLVGSVGATAAGGAGVSGGAGPVRKDVASFTALFSGTGATIGYDDRTNSLVVTGTPAQQEAVEALLQQLDVPIPQVMVQATVVDITSSSLQDLGISWSLMETDAGTPFTFNESTAPGQTPPGNLSLQPLVRDSLLARLHAFVSQGHAKVLSDPRIATFDGQEALIFAGDQIPIVNTTTAGNPPVTTQTVTFQPVGVTLKIIPKVNADRSVTVQIHPVVTTVTKIVSGNPQIAVREAVTSLSIPDGGSLILGGLLKFSDIESLKKIPLLGDLPFIGSLFQLNNINHSESEVVIIMTPRILTTGTPVP